MTAGPGGPALPPRTCKPRAVSWELLAGQGKVRGFGRTEHYRSAPARIAPLAPYDPRPGRRACRCHGGIHLADRARPALPGPPVADLRAGQRPAGLRSRADRRPAPG